MQDLARCLQSSYGINATALTQLSGGLDARTKSFKVATSSAGTFFLKLRHGEVNLPALHVPRELADAGICGVLPPIRTVGGDLFAKCLSAALLLYPFVDGLHAGSDGLSATQWRELGALLREVHSCPLDPSLVATIRQDKFELPSATRVRRALRELDAAPALRYGAARFASLLLAHRHRVEEILERAEKMRSDLVGRRYSRVVCHSDLHPWNVMVGGHGGLYLMDWEDGPLLAAKERDFIFVPDEHLDVFLRGYGSAELDEQILEFYWLERLIEDTASTAELVFESDVADEPLIDEYIAQQERFFAALASKRELGTRRPK